MKILEKGPGWSLEELCTGKGNGDIYLTSRTDMIGDIDYFYTFRCPVCGVETDISEKDVPSSIKRDLLETEKGVYTRRREWK